MDWKNLALSGVVAGSLLGGVGCGESGYVFPARDNGCTDGATPCATSETAPATTDEARTVVLPETMADTTQTWVLAVVGLPEATAGGQAAGFNLDNLDSGEGSSAADANCEEFNEDFTGLDDSGHVGVDNALQGLVGTIEGLLDADDCGGSTMGCLDRTLQQQIAEGSIILMMQVSGINDFQFDDEVTLQLVQGEVAGGGMPMVGGDGTLAAGQSFTTTMNLGSPVTGDIFQGRLRANTGSLTIPINAGGFMLPLIISNPQIRFTISTDGSRLTNGQIGGSIMVEDIVSAVAEIMPDLEDTVRGVIENVADVGPSANPQICEAVSVGLTFEAVSAELN